MPRRSRGALLPPIPAPRVRRGDVYRALRDAMLDGTLGQGVLLPSTRMLAVEYGMSRTTIEDVYDQLVSEGLIERSIGRGSFVAGLWPAPARHTPGPVLRLSRRGERLGANAACREPLVLRPFNAGVPDVSLFPWKVWERCWRRAQEALGREGLNHCDSAGYRPLRAALASYLAQSRGVRARPEQVVVFNSTAQALHTLFLLLLDRGDTLWVEEPGYPGVRAAAHLVEAKA
ncbi:MAG: aminotransferase class I/II-fold pyridoxal phosphate-dependent enzyme, partial [Myxococcaceae bacterium]